MRERVESRPTARHHFPTATPLGFQHTTVPRAVEMGHDVVERVLRLGEPPHDAARVPQRIHELRAEHGGIVRRRPHHRERGPQHRNGRHERAKILVRIRPQHRVADDDRRPSAEAQRPDVVESQRIGRCNPHRAAPRVFDPLVLIMPSKPNQRWRARQGCSGPLRRAVPTRRRQSHRHERRGWAIAGTGRQQCTGANVGKGASPGQ